jgi:hypothetical protein
MPAPARSAAAIPQDTPYNERRARKARHWTAAALFATASTILVTGGVWLGSTPSLATCTTTDGHRITLVAITEDEEREQRYVPGPRWRTLLVGFLPPGVARRMGLGEPIMAELAGFASFPPHYWIRVPRGSLYHASARCPDEEEHLTVSSIHTTWGDSDYLVADFSFSPVRDIQIFKYGPELFSRQIVGVLPVP